MDLQAPTPQHVQPTKDTSTMNGTVQPSVSITVAGCGGAGLNWARHFLQSRRVKTLLFDTSMANSLPGERVNIVTNGSGSGGNRSENARDIEREIPQISDEDIGKADVAIVIFSTAGGSGSVIGPLLIREYARRGVRPIGVVITDTSSTIGAKNTQNTLKTLVAVSKNNDIYLPTILLSNDHVTTNREVDVVGVQLINAIIEILTDEVLEIDRNDRLNWVNSSKVTGSPAGLKIMSFYTEKFVQNPSIVIGIESEEIVDSILIIQPSRDESVLDKRLPPSRLKKTGLFIDPKPRIVGKVSSDISSVNAIIDQVDRTINAAKAQKHQSVSRLEDASGGDDLHL